MQDDLIFCPSCEEDSLHTVVKDGQELLVRCDQCGTVHPTGRERSRISSIRVMVSRDGSTSGYTMTMQAKDVLKTGDYLLVDDGINDVVPSEITSIETYRRESSAAAEDIRTIWVRAIDKVQLKISVFKRGRTRSFKVLVSGDRVYRLGEVGYDGSRRFVVEKIKLRKRGFADSANARDIVRIWGREI